MPTIAIKLPAEQLQAAKSKSRQQGFKTASAWVSFVVEQNLGLEEPPQLKPERIIAEMRKTDLYQERFLQDLKKSLEYADQTN